ncbi:MAG: hypothetical protein H7323_06815 [Frankiales bacterium]|nr:hypothetical protein [Frankiales bacterium]
MTATQAADTAACCADRADADWGRLPGARPPLAWWLPVVAFAMLMVVLSLVVVLVVRAPGPGDDPDPAEQRNGLLLDGPVLAAQVAGVRFGGRTVVVLFERTPPGGPAYDAWRRAAGDDGVELVVAVAGRQGAAALATQLAMPAPVDGGPPVGYAVVDADRRVRYATLDPTYVDNAFEVGVITGAVG